MGKASSAKKVARVAKVGGKSAQPRRNLGFPLVIMVLLAGGILAVWAARSSVNSNANVFPVANKDHIHMAYAINDCGKWLAPIPTFESSFGIHTHGDGVLHIHPYLASASGKNATFSVFEDGAGMTTSPTGLHYTGVTVKGDCNGKPAVLRAAYWNKVVDANNKPLPAGTKPDRIYTKDFGKMPLNHNGGGITFFYGSPTATIPLPNSIAGLISALGGNESGNVATTVPGSTVPGTTVKGSATTVAPSATTAAGSAPSTTAAAN